MTLVARSTLLAALALAPLCVQAQPAPSSATDAKPAEARSGKAGIGIELNRLEPAANSCRGYFVVNNQTTEQLKELRIDVFLFDRAGTVMRRVALAFTDVRPERTKVLLFDLADAPCAEIGRLLVNDVLGCTAGNGAPIKGCAEMITATTRTSAEFRY